MKSKKLIQITAIAFAVSSAFLFVGCDNTNTLTPKPKSVSGVITGFGSVFVDGVEYETNTSAIEIEGQKVSDDSALKVGMYVTLEGIDNSNGTGVATKVKYADDVEGKVVSNDIATNGTLNVLGQIVHVDASTVFESKVAGQRTAADIANGNRVEVSGFSSNGEIYATRIEVKSASVAPGEEMELKGVIASLDSTAKTFNLGNTVVAYNGAKLEVTPANGTYVEVKTTQGIVSGQLIASKIEAENGGKKGEDYSKLNDDGTEIKIEGALTAELANGQIEVNGTKINLSSSTVKFEHGTASDLKVGVKLKVEVTVAADGSLTAKEISFRAAGNRKLVGAVEAVDVANNTITVLGEKITINNFTLVNDEDDSNGRTDRYFHLKTLLVGDWVEVRVFKDDIGNLVATKLERNSKSESNEVELKGTIESYDATTKKLVVNGVTIDLSNVIAGNLNSFAVGTLVEIEGKFENGVWTEVKIEIHSSSDDDDNKQESRSTDDLDG